MCVYIWASLVPQMVKNLPTMQETWVWSLHWEDPLEKRMAIHSHILAWRIPRTEEPGGPQSMELQRVRHDWATNTHTHTHVYVYTHIHNGILWSTEKEGCSDTCYNMDEFWGHWAKPVTKDKYSVIPLIGVTRIVKFIKTESKMMVARSWAEWGVA